MPDREKVIEILENAKMVIEGWVPMFEQYNTPAGIDVAIAMLREQKAIEPKKENDGNPEPCTSWWYVCGDCGRYIDPHDRFCRHCGREVKWE